LFPIILGSAQPVPGGSLDLGTVTQFVSPLLIPPVMPSKGVRFDPVDRKLVNYYEIEVVQFQQQILPAGHHRLELRRGRPPRDPHLSGLDPNGNHQVRRMIHEIPIVIQDRSFNNDGSLFYPGNRAFFEGLEPNQLLIPFISVSSLSVRPSGPT